MPIQSFAGWLDRRDHAVPIADQIVPLIAQAGPQGISRGHLGRLLDMERDALDELLDGLVRFGLLRMTVENGVRVFRPQSF